MRGWRADGRHDSGAGRGDPTHLQPTRRGRASGGRRRKVAIGSALLVPVAVVVSFLAGAQASGAEFAAEAAVAPTYQYLDDRAGTTFTLTIFNTGTTASIGAVEIRRPSHTSNNWTVTACPSAPAGWTAQATALMCRYRSQDGPADNIPPQTANDDFRMTATTQAGTQNRVGTFDVVVSKSDQFDTPSTIPAISAVAMPPGLTTTVHTFEVTDAVVASSAVLPGTPCPAADKDELTGASTTLVVCGRNRSLLPLTPNATNSSLAGTFVASPGSFSSNLVAPTGSTGAPVVLGNWSGATVTSNAGPGKTVVAVIGSAANQNSPATTLTGYEALNQPPVAADDSAAAAEDGPSVTVDVLGNDTDPEGRPLTVSAVDTSGTAGSVTNNGTNVTYDPAGAFEHLAAGATAVDTFAYTVSDEHGASDTATVTVTVTGANDAPVANGDAAAAGEDGPAVVVDVLGNDTDADDGAVLTVAAIDDTATAGAVTNNGGNVTYDPAGAFEHLAAGETAVDSFTYTVSDEHGTTDTATVTVTVSGANDAPDAVDDAAAANEGGPSVAVDVLANDTDADASDVLSVSAVGTAGTAGSVVNNGSGVTYDPAGAFEHLAAGETAVDSFTYTVSDQHGATDTATVTVTVSGANDAPDAVDDAAAANEDGPAVAVDVLANDTDPDASDVLSVSAVGTAGTAGSVVNNGSSVTYDPAGAFEHLAAGETAVDSFTYTASDGNGGSDTATVTVTVTGANDAPVAHDDAATVTEDSAATSIAVLANDTDADAGASLSVAAVGATTNGGSAVASGAGVSYTPPAAANALAVGESLVDTFTYTVSDQHGATDTATVTVTVTGVNDAPTAVDDDASVEEDGPPVVVDVLTNDTDPDASDVLSVASVTATANGGTVTNNGTSVSYDPNGAFDHLSSGQTATDTFSYTASDGHGGTDTATVTVTVVGTNAAPVANGDSFGGAIGNTKFAVGVTVTGEPVVNAAGNLLTNDTDPDGDALSASFVSASPGAAVTVNSDGSFTYVSPPGLEGTDTFTYRVSDPSGASTTAAVAIAVDEVVWYVDNTKAAGNGTSVSPFAGLGPLQGADADEPDDHLFLYEGSGAYPGGIVLEADQRLWGQPHGLVVAGHTLVAAGGANPDIANASGNGVTLANGVDVQAVDVVGSSGAGVAGAGVSTVTIGSSTVSGAAGDGVRLHGANDVSLSQVNVQGAAATAGATCHGQSAADCSAGVDLVDASDVTLDRVTVDGSGQQGISGHRVSGLTITNSTIDNAGNGNDEFGLLLSRISGTALVEDTVIDHSEEGGVRLYADSGTAALTLRRVTIRNNDTVTGEDGLNVEVGGTGTATVLVDDSTLTELDRDGVDANVAGTGTLNLTVRATDLTNNEGGGVVAAATNTATLRAAITDNTITNLVGTGIGVTGAVNSTVHATVTGNAISHPAPPTAQSGFGIRLVQDEDGDFTALVENNSTTGTGFGGIKVLSRLGNRNLSPGTSAGDTGTMHATVRNNVVGLPANTDFGIEVNALNAENAVCTAFTGNTATGNGVAGIRARQVSTSTYSVEGLAAGSQTAATMATYLDTNNTSVPAATATATTNFTGVAAGTCRSAASTPLP